MKNIEKQKEHAKKWRANNKDRVKEYDKKWRERNKDHVKEYEKKRRNEKRIEIRQKAKEYRQKNSSRIKEYDAKRNMRISHRFNAGKHLAKKRNYEWRLTLDEYVVLLENGKCHYCDFSLSKQGSGLDRKNDEPYYSVENVVPCCGNCNKTFIAGFSYEEKLRLSVVLKEIYMERARVDK
jgi:hypothetical protein